MLVAWTTPGQTQWYRDPDCKYCSRQASLGEYYQCEDVNRSEGTDRTGPYKDCKITRSSPDGYGYVHNECQGTVNCGPNSGPDTTMIGNTRYYTVNLQRSCPDALYNGHRKIVSANSGIRA